MGDGAEASGLRKGLMPAPCSRGLSQGECVCRAAVIRAYGGMMAAGLPDSKALDAAVRVYRYHHPDEPVDRARDLVETWVFTGPLH
jgi:hypothetical protein